VVEKLIDDSVFEGSNPGTACNAREKIGGKYFDARPEEIAHGRTSTYDSMFDGSNPLATACTGR
jgi:hypothetical protein